MKRLVYGIGVYEKGTYLTKVDGKPTPEYRLWINMLKRCYSKSFHEKQPTYASCTVSENFKNFQYFAGWCQSQVGFNIKGYHLDKDLLSEDKLYSENTCVFVPRQINSLLVVSASCSGLYPLGVTFDSSRGMYEAKISKNGSNKHLGWCSTPEKASLKYKAAKECHVKFIADEYKSQIDPRVYEALILWKV